MLNIAALLRHKHYRPPEKNAADICFAFASKTRKHFIFLPIKQLYKCSSPPKRCNSSLARHKSSFQTVSMEMRRRFRVKLRQSDPELQVCPIPRYLREQEVLTSRARSRQTPPPSHAHCIIHLHAWKYLSVCLSVCHSFLWGFFCSVSKVCCLSLTTPHCLTQDMTYRRHMLSVAKVSVTSVKRFFKYYEICSFCVKLLLSAFCGKELFRYAITIMFFSILLFKKRLIY